MEVQEEAEEIEIQPRAPVSEKEKSNPLFFHFFKENKFEIC